MGGSVSQVFRSGSALLSHRDGHKVSKATEEKIQTLFEILRANPKISLQTLESLLIQIPKNENILVIYDDCGYNILQRSVGLNHIDLTKWLLHRHRPDVNRSPCSLPLHIATLRGYEECVELLLRHGARIDVDTRMCFPGAHTHNCEESGKWHNNVDDVSERLNNKLQNALCYAIDGDQYNVLSLLTQKMEEPWIPFRAKKPLLHLACERGAWNCVQQLVLTRSEEINLIMDEYYPIHHAVLHDGRFLELLIQQGAVTTVRTCTQQMTLLHVVIFAARKPAEDTLATLRILLERGCKELINAPDSLGNTPLHALIVRYALEEARYGYDKWSKWDVLYLVRFLLQNGAKQSINQAGNSAMACVFRHLRDWEVCYELLNMLIKEDGDPNIVGRDGSVPIMVLLVPLINKDHLHHFTHSMKVCYLNCIRILLQHGANPNCSYRANLKPLHVLVFTVSENFTLNCDAQKRTNFDFIKNILLLLLQHGLDCNKTYQHILQAVMDMVQNVRTCHDMECIYELTLTLIQYGADPNIKDNIPVEIMKRIRKEFIPNKDFDPKVVAKASSAAKGLCQWIIAMDMYDDVAKVVAPKKAKLAGAEKEYADTMSFLAEKRALAAALEEKVALLNIELDKANEEMKKTEEHAENCRNKLLRAEALIGGLGGEKSRWNKAADDLQELYDHLPGDVLLSCGIIAYLSAVNLQSRTECVNDWFQKVTKLKIPCSKKYSITEVLGLEVTIQNWQLDGLPNDEFSSENAIIVSSSSRYSLFIDPQGQANNWLKNMERKNRLNCVKFNQGNYMRIIAEAMEYGTPVIIENVQEELEVPLDPILMHQTFIQGGVKHISLGEAVVPLSPNFRLYMTCNLRNPHFLPETFNKVTVINFALTQNALMDQLLSIVILGESKGLSKDIQEKQEAAKETSAKIEAFRLNYKPVAVHSSILYYSITDLPNIDPMYQFSLNWYINLYMYSIDTANKSKDLPRRIKFLVDGFTKNLYNNVCRSIFEKDKLLFSFILTARVLLGTGQVEMRHLAHLVTNAKESSHMPPNPDHSWITETVWLNVLRLEELKELRGIVDAFRKNLSAWQAIYDHASPELQPLPAPWNDKTTAFEKIIVLKALRPDSVFLAVRNFIALTIGDQFVSPPEFDISKSYADSTALTPLVFILSPGADPLGSLLAFAEKMGQEETFQSISLGQGQGPIATALIKSAQEMGYWVCLQNCHLAASWMPALEYMWENMDTFNTVPNFRLWLTAYPTPQFPVTILQNGVKMTNEPPTGLRENLMRSYNSEPINEYEFYAGCAKQDRAFTRLLYGICFFHAVVQERRKYGPLGWNIAYGFNESDLQISVLQLSVVADNRYRFATDDRYILPRKMEHREMLPYPEDNIPSLAPPEVYGPHANSGITRDLQTTKTLLDSMILLLGSEAAGTAGAGVSAVQIILNTTKQIGADMHGGSREYPVDYNESMNTVVVQEMERFLKLQKEIRASCRDLAMGIKGIIVMTPDLENVMTAMKFNRIPLKWMSKSYPSLKPLGSYVQDLYKRLNWLFHWYMHGKPPTFWLSGFFFTQAFLTGAMQNFARKYKIPIDTLTFDYDVLKVETKATPPDDGVYCNGLFVEGARWDWEHNMLVEQYPKILIYIMPVIFFRPVLILDLVEGTRYKCPLYKTGERKGTLSTTGHSTNYVVPLLLNTQAKPSHWVKRSVALICQTND
ncbi:GL16213 [Drosophila persimilis]|uniref:GL16213 n=1 Tax=Drosophila persimilis TaxID=7234 RepID=B4H5R7_DROPE|nr:GL16213 [Drosophila persimilis]